jgi:hypothetical protein
MSSLPSLIRDNTYYTLGSNGLIPLPEVNHTQFAYTPRWADITNYPVGSNGLIPLPEVNHAIEAGTWIPLIRDNNTYRRNIYGEVVRLSNVKYPVDANGLIQLPVVNRTMNVDLIPLPVVVHIGLPTNWSAGIHNAPVLERVDTFPAPGPRSKL